MTGADLRLEGLPAVPVLCLVEIGGVCRPFALASQTIQPNKADHTLAWLNGLGWLDWLGWLTVRPWLAVCESCRRGRGVLQSPVSEPGSVCHIGKCHRQA